MINYLLFIFIIVFVGVLLYVLYRNKRLKIYHKLANMREQLLYKYLPVINKPPDTDFLHKLFCKEHLIRIDNFLTESSLEEVKSECEANKRLAERSYLPFHKQGKTLSYENIHRFAPACLGIYHSKELRTWLSEIVGDELYLTPEQDQSSCSILYYTSAGDHINWHFDHNFYNGRHFTVLISVENRSAEGGIATGKLMRKTSNKIAEVIDTSENTLVLFEGAKVLHRATRVKKGESRIMLSMTFCTNPRIGYGNELIRRIKDIAYYGPRALVD